MLAIPSWVGFFDHSGQSWGTSQGSVTAPEMDGEEPGPGAIQELPSKAKAERAGGRT